MDTSLSYSKLILDSQPDILVMVDEQTRILRINETALSFFHTERHKILGKRFDDLCHGKVRTKFQPLFQDISDTQASFFENTLDGQRHFHWKIRKLGQNVSKFEHIETFLITGNDTTEIFAAQEQARAAEAKNNALQSYLRQELEARILMVSELAHRMNNPLNYISTSLHALHLELVKVRKDIHFLFTEVFENAEELRGIGEGFLTRLENMDEYVKIMEKGVQKSSISVSEIRSLSGVDGHHVDKIQIDEALDGALQRLFENVGDLWRTRLVVTHSLDSHAYLYSNRFALIIALEMIFRRWTQIMPEGFELSLFWMAEEADRPAISIITNPHDLQAWSDAMEQLIPQVNHILSGFHLGLSIGTGSVTIATLDSADMLKV